MFQKGQETNDQLKRSTAVNYDALCFVFFFSIFFQMNETPLLSMGLGIC